jgi:peptidoglycan hydrolase CwlO-like protein
MHKKILISLIVVSIIELLLGLFLWQQLVGKYNGESEALFRKLQILTIIFLSLVFIIICFLIWLYFVLKKTDKELFKKYSAIENEGKKLEETKASLEIKIQARTRELQELTERLEEQVKKRTKELQDKIAELERFSRLAVGRELKMIELKKEIKKLKGELEKTKGRKRR